MSSEEAAAAEEIVETPDVQPEVEQIPELDEGIEDASEFADERGHKASISLLKSGTVQICLSDDSEAKEPSCMTSLNPEGKELFDTAKGFYAKMGWHTKSE